MKISSYLKSIICLAFLILLHGNVSSQSADEIMLSKIRKEGLQNSQAMEMLSKLSDIYGQRLTGSREYYAAACWMAEEMKRSGLQNVHFEKYCPNCRGWSMKSFNVEMTAPNFMHINAYPLAMAKGTNGLVSGEVVHIESMKDVAKLKETYGGNLKDKIILLGKIDLPKSFDKPLASRYTIEQLNKMENQLVAGSKPTPLPELLKSWETSDISDQEFLTFAETEGALAVLVDYGQYPGILGVGGSYFYKKDQFMPLPYMTIMPEHFGRLVRMIKLGTTPTINLNLETEFYYEPENNVNVIGELTGTDPKLKSETILVGGHFDSWHAGTGAADNGSNCIVLVEALRILKQVGYAPKRTLRVGLWGGEEQAFIGSVDYAIEHYGALDAKPNAESKKVSAYLNLDNGAGAIRGMYLQENELARPVFKKIFEPLDGLSEGALTIDNTYSTDHETFDHFNIPAFQFIQDGLTYGSVTHHTQLDVVEYVPENDLKKNAVILAWTLYSLSEMNGMVPRK